MVNRKQSWRGFRRDIGERLREVRIAKGLSQEELALEIDVAQGSISNYEIGRSDIPLSVLIAICHALRVSPGQFLPHWEPIVEPGQGPNPCPACREALRIA